MRKLLLSAAIAAVASPSFAATNLIQNGSFENGTVNWVADTTGLGQQGYTAAVVIDYNQAGQYPLGAFGEAVPTDNNAQNPNLDPVGNRFLYLSSDVGIQSVTQTVTLLANTTYTFGFDYYLPHNGYANPNPANFSASLDGVSFANFSLGNQPETTWLHAFASNTFTTGGTGDFLFSFTASAYPAKDVALDRVYLTETSPAPEPATWAMMVGGFGLIGAAMRRRKPQLTFA